MTTNESYLYDQRWEHERARLAGLAAQFDATTIRHLDALGVAPGWHCLEVGAGAGSIARWLAAAVGRSGRVVATDLDPRFLADLPEPAEVLRHNVVEDALPAGEFDLIHARAVLEHIPERAAVVGRLIAALRPGGLLVVEDVVIGGPLRPAAERVVAPSAQSILFGQTLDAFAAAFRAVGADPEFGLALPAVLEAAGLHGVDAELTARRVRGGSPEAAFYDLSLREIGGRLVAAGLLSEAEVVEALALTAAPASRWLSLGLVTAWGRRADDA